MTISSSVTGGCMCPLLSIKYAVNDLVGDVLPWNQEDLHIGASSSQDLGPIFKGRKKMTSVS